MGFEVRKAEYNEDKGDIYSLWQRNLPVLNEGRLEWFYRQNPSGNSETVVALNDVNEIIGSGSYFLRGINVSGERLLMSTAADFSIDKKYRLFGPAIPLQRKLLELTSNRKDVRGVFAFPNKSGSGVFLRIGYKTISTAEFWSKPLSLKKFLNRKLNNKVIADLLSQMADSFVRVWIRLKREKLPVGWVVKKAEKFTSAIDDLWNEANAMYDITPVRNAEFLNWRYIDNPVDKYKLVIIEDNLEGVQGYVIYKEINDIIEIVDLFSIKSPSLYKYLIQSVIEIALTAKKSSVVLSFVGGAEFKGVLQGMGFRCSANVDRSLVAYMDDETVLNPERWFIFEGDMDL